MCIWQYILDIAPVAQNWHKAILGVYLQLQDVNPAVDSL